MLEDSTNHFSLVRFIQDFYELDNLVNIPLIIEKKERESNNTFPFIAPASFSKAENPITKSGTTPKEKKESSVWQIGRAHV